MRGHIENARVVGYEWDLRLCFSVEYRLSVVAGVERDDAIRAGEELALHGRNQKPLDRDLVHTEVEDKTEVFEDEPEAIVAADWLDHPVAPSEETFFDDSRHFDDVEAVQDGEDDE